MSLYGVELNHQIDRLITEIRLQLHKHKLLPNVRTIYRSFAKYDHEISGIIRTDHFEKVIIIRYRLLDRMVSSLRNTNIKSLKKLLGISKGILDGFSFCKL